MSPSEKSGGDSLENFQRLQQEFDDLRAELTKIDIEIKMAHGEFEEAKRDSDDWWTALRKLNRLYPKRQKIRKEMSKLRLILEEVKAQI